MSNVLEHATQQQILALGRLGWTLSRIQETTGVRRETISGYLKAAGIAVRSRGRPSESTKTGNFAAGGVHRWVGPDENNPITVKGSLEKNILTLRTFPRPGRTVAFDRCHVTVSGDKMTGKIEREGSGEAGTIAFVRSAKK
jgi:hypothetical protein